MAMKPDRSEDWGETYGKEHFTTRFYETREGGITAVVLFDREPIGIYENLDRGVRLGSLTGNDLFLAAENGFRKWDTARKPLDGVDLDNEALRLDEEEAFVAGVWYGEAPDFYPENWGQSSALVFTLPWVENTIDDYYLAAYGSGADFSRLDEVPLAAGQTEDGKTDLEAAADLRGLRILYFYDGALAKEEKFADLSELKQWLDKNLVYTELLAAAERAGKEQAARKSAPDENPVRRGASL